MDVTIGQLYRHKSRGIIVKVLDFGTLEWSLEKAVLYEHVPRDEFGTWVRPLSSFADGRFEPYVKPVTDPHLCPDRASSLAAIKFPGPDSWDVMPNKDRTCSFCGSLHPDDFLRLVEAAADPGKPDHRLDPTTKGYKWYVNQPGVDNALQGGIKFYNWHITKEAVPQETLDRLNELIPKALAASEVKYKAYVERILPTPELGGKVQLS